MKIYLLGPEPLNDNCIMRFADAEKKLIDSGHIVINPVYLPRGLGERETYAHILFPMIDVCDAIVVLDGWERSCVGCMEYGYAAGTDKTIVDYQTMIYDDREKV